MLAESLSLAETEAFEWGLMTSPDPQWWWRGGREAGEFKKKMAEDELRIFVRRWGRERMIILWAFGNGRVFYEETTY